MFTGIVEATGEVRTVVTRDRGARVMIDAVHLDLSDVAVGDSIAVDGCCLTVVELTSVAFSADVSKETLDCTIGFKAGSRVNLEKSLRVTDRLGGHLVSGHVDGRGQVAGKEAVGDNWRLEIECLPELARYVARKGSIAVNGVSLTINRVVGDRFDVNLIPHTLQVTNLGVLRTADYVNLEVDLFARYIERLLSASM